MKKFCIFLILLGAIANDDSEENKPNNGIVTNKMSANASKMDVGSVLQLAQEYHEERGLENAMGLEMPEEKNALNETDANTLNETEEQRGLVAETIENEMLPNDETVRVLGESYADRNKASCKTLSTKFQEQPVYKDDHCNSENFWSFAAFKNFRRGTYEVCNKWDITRWKKIPLDCPNGFINTKSDKRILITKITKKEHGSEYYEYWKRGYKFNASSNKRAFYAKCCAPEKVQLCSKTKLSCPGTWNAGYYHLDAGTHNAAKELQYGGLKKLTLYDGCCFDRFPKLKYTYGGSVGYVDKAYSGNGKTRDQVFDGARCYWDRCNGLGAGGWWCWLDGFKDKKWGYCSNKSDPTVIVDKYKLPLILIAEVEKKKFPEKCEPMYDDYNKATSYYHNFCSTD